MGMINYPARSAGNFLILIDAVILKSVYEILLPHYFSGKNIRKFYIYSKSVGVKRNSLVIISDFADTIYLKYV